MKKIVIASACRTAIGKFGGTLANVPAAELGSIVIKEALDRAHVKPEQVDQVYMGCVIQAGLGQNVARQASLKAGLPMSVPYTCVPIGTALMVLTSIEVILKNIQELADEKKGGTAA